MPSNSEPSPLTQIGEDSLVGLIEDGFYAGVNDLGRAVFDLPGFIADPNPPAATAFPLKPLLRAACRNYARGGGAQNLPGFDSIWGGICNPYLDSIGELPEGGSLERPFTGGQCPVVYRVRGQIELFPFSDCSTFGPGAFDIGLQGPILGLVYKVENPSGDLCTPKGNNVYVRHGNPVREEILGGAGYGVSVTGFNVVREDGLPDNCGSPPIIYTPPRPVGGLPPVGPQPIDFPGIGPINVDVSFDPSGNINVELPDFPVTVNIPNPFDGGGGDEGGGGGGGGPAPGDPGDPGAPTDVGAGGEAEGEAPPGKVLTGVRVQLLNVPPSKNQYTSEVYRGVYYVYMGTPGLLEHHPSGAMVTADQFTYASKDFLTVWRVRANDKWSIRVTPYYREVE